MYSFINQYIRSAEIEHGEGESAEQDLVISNFRLTQMLP